ncbi:MAG: hypothetical protein JNN13_08575 [Planctomycetes bacterium]|nr:hypothetical protein [Planctomycetota bacterium]
MSNSWRRSWWPPLLLCAAACWQAAPQSQPFGIVRTSPDLAAGQPVLLNEALTVYFSDAILPLSVTSDSVTVLDDAGHQVPGALRCGANWVTFVPEPPLAADLDDGSFRPGRSYRLLIAGCPRPDAVRAQDGRRLAEAAAFDVRAAARDELPAGLPAPLRPPASDLPFALQTPEVSQQLPADAARALLHFTLPVLPSSLSAESFRILRFQRMGEPPEALQPRSVRLVTTRFDEFPGSAIEIDLGSLPQRVDAAPTSRLRVGDLINITLVGDASLRDYSGSRLLPVTSQSLWWHVVDGASIALVEWPSGSERLAADDAVLPSFERHAGLLRPRLRVECGDGSLGMFRPTRDTTVRQGQPFDRGDGQMVVGTGSTLPFLAIDVPPGVKVTIDAAAAPVHLLVAGGVHVAGELELLAPAGRVPVRRLQTPPIDELREAAAIAVIAGGAITIDGRVTAPVDASWLLASADRLVLGGELPLHTLLAFDAATESSAPAIEGPRGQSTVVPAAFTYGVPPAADFQVSGWTPWRQLPVGRDGGVLQLVDRVGDLSVAWQSAPVDSYRPELPDLGVGRVSRSQLVVPESRIGVPAGAFVRFELAARVRGGRPLPGLRELRLVDR